MFEGLLQPMHLIIIGIIFAFFYVLHINKKKKDIENRLSLIPDFTVTQKVFGIDGYAGLAIDEEKKKICLIYPRQKDAFYSIISYKDLLSSEIFEDGVTVTKTMRLSQIGGALIGGAVFGGVGAIIGGLSGKRKATGNVNRIDLRIIINDTKNPIHDVNFLNHKIKKNNWLYPEYQEAIQSVRHWHGLVEVLIKRADMEDKQNTASPPIIQQGSVADELKKLADLKNLGALSDQEFQQQKSKLLGS